MRLILVSIFSLLFIQSYLNAQEKVGLVFSGGGTKGIAYVGVLKALEEHDIPIDYIVGTSSGGIIAAFYASGYTVEELLQLMEKKEVTEMFGGKIKSGLNAFFDNNSNSNALLTLQFNLGKKNNIYFNPNIINASYLQLQLNNYFFKASEAANNDFNQLMIPFRCVYSNIDKNTFEYVQKGFLPEQVRAAMNVPVIYPTYYIDGVNVTDGGIFNNFPVNVIKKEFNPDVVIGIKVSQKLSDEQNSNNSPSPFSNVFSSILTNNSGYYDLTDKDVYISPELDNFQNFSFENYKDIVEEGYNATILKMPEIKAKIKKRRTKTEREEIRKKFKTKQKTSDIKKINIIPTMGKKSTYVKKKLGTDQDFKNEDFEKGYRTLATTSYFNNLNPKTIYNEEKKEHHLNIFYDDQDQLKLYFGGMIANQGNSLLSLGIKWEFINKNFYSIYSNAYIGQFKTYLELGARIFPASKWANMWEIYIDGSFYDFQALNSISFENQQFLFLKSTERSIGLRTQFKLFYEGVFETFAEYHFGRYEHSASLIGINTNNNLVFDNFVDGLKIGINYTLNTLNRNDYPDKGGKTAFRFYYFNGTHDFRTNQALSMFGGISPKDWFSVKHESEIYFDVPKTNWYSIGLLIEGVYSNQRSFAREGYKFEALSMLTLPKFNPFWNSDSFVNSKYSLPNYAAAGIKNIFKITKSLQFRLEYYFHNLYLIESTITGEIKGVNSDFFPGINKTLGAILVFNSFIAPISIGFHNYGGELNFRDPENETIEYFIKIGFPLGSKFKLQ